MFLIDMRMDNRSTLDDGSTNWAYYYRTSVGGADIPEPLGYNPMVDVWLRRAIATIVNKDQMVKQIVGGPPYTIAAMYTPLSAAYGGYVHPQITPTGTLASYTYLNSTGFGQSQVQVGNAYLNAHGYNTYNAITGKRQLNGKDFYIDFYYRADHVYRTGLATVVMAPLLTAAPPNGLGLAVNMLGVTSAGGRTAVMDQKRGHMYTGGWGLTMDPDHLWYLFANPAYWHPGRPPNYMYYPGDGNQYTVTTPGFTVTNAILNGWGYPSGTGMATGILPVGSPDLDLSDTKVWSVGSKVWKNPGNYWAWEMMIATDQPRATLAAWKCQEWLAFWVSGDPVYTNNGYAAFHRTYVGNDNSNLYLGQKWMGVVNAKAFGVWTTASGYNMHPANANWGTGSATNITMRWGFRQPTMSLNPMYAEWVWDWYVMNNIYDSMIGANAYTLANTGNLALNWQLSTWTSPSLGTCSKITFNMRHDLLWSDGMPITSSDVYFTWGGPLVPGSLSNLLASNGLPPTFWSTNLIDILSIATPDPWTVVVYLDVQAFFALHSMSGFNYVLPQHIWQPIILAVTGATNPFNMPSVCSGGWLLPSTADPGAGGTITLLRNPLHNMQSGGKPMPLTISTVQTSNATTAIGNTHWIYPSAPIGPQKAVTMSVSVTIDSSYYYTTGPNQTDVYNYTKLDGLKNVTLWKWTGVGNPSNVTAYTKIADIATNVPWAAGRAGTTALPDIEILSLGTLSSGYYFVKVEALILTLNVSTDGGVTWPAIIPNSLNPFYGMVKTYNESCIVTSRYDIGGKLWKPLVLPKYQIVPDLKVNLVDTFTSALAFGSQPGFSNWTPAADVNGDIRINLQDVFAIALAYGSVF
jgi:ABC-type transport system substrate-binding protein